MTTPESPATPAPAPAEGEGCDSPWCGPYESAARALDATRRAVAEMIGADPETWPAHGNAPLAITSSLALAQLRAAAPAGQGGGDAAR